MLICYLKKIFFSLIFLINFILLNVILSHAESINNHLTIFEGKIAQFEIDQYTGNSYILYFKNDEEFIILSLAENRSFPVSLKGFTADGANLAFTDKEILVLWRPKEMSTGYKYAYFDRYDRKNFKKIDRKIINTEKDVLLPLKLYLDKNEIIVTWVDERNPKRSTTFMNFSTDSGKTFNKSDISVGGEDYLFNTTYIKDKNSIHYFFGSGCIKENQEEKCGIVYKTTNNLEKKQFISGIITEMKEWSPHFIDSILTSKGIMVMWAGARGIYVANNYNGGSKWDVKPLPGTTDMAVSRLSHFIDKKGNLYIVASYRKNLDRNDKDNVYLFISNDHGEKWTEPIPIRNYPYKSTMALNPDIYIKEDGTIVVVWQDHRFIRGNIFMNYSKDGGKTWQKEDINISIEPQGSKNEIYPTIKGFKDKLYVMWYQSKDDGLRGDRIIKFKEMKLP